MEWMNWLVRIAAGVRFGNALALQSPERRALPGTQAKLQVVWSQGAGLVGVGLSLLYLLQEKLIYVPRIPGVSNAMVYTPDEFAFSYEVPRPAGPQPAATAPLPASPHNLSPCVCVCVSSSRSAPSHCGRR